MKYVTYMSIAFVFKQFINSLTEELTLLFSHVCVLFRTHSRTFHVIIELP